MLLRSSGELFNWGEGVTGARLWSMKFLHVDDTGMRQCVLSKVEKDRLVDRFVQ